MSVVNDIEKYSFVPEKDYTTEDWAAFFKPLFTNGVFPNPDNGLMVIANNDMSVTIKKGEAWIEGYQYRLVEDMKFTIANADGKYNRIVNVVVRLDRSLNVINAALVYGEFSSKPVAPVVVRNANMFELKLCEVYVERGTITISQRNITDTRLNTVVCGKVAQAVKNFDTTNIYNQIQSDLVNFKKQQATDYEQYTKSAVAMYKELEKLISESETGLKDMSYSEYTKLLSWFSEYKTGLVAKYNQLEEDIRGILTKEAETNLLMMIKDLQASQVNGLVGELVLDGKVDVSNYPTYQLFETMGGAGTQGAGSAGAGYFSNKTIPVEVEATSHNTLKVYASPQYASENSTIVQNSSSNWTILNEQTNKFLSFNIKN